MRPSGIEVNKPLVAFIFLAITAVIWYSISGASISSLWASSINAGDLAKDRTLVDTNLDVKTHPTEKTVGSDKDTDTNPDPKTHPAEKTDLDKAARDNKSDPVEGRDTHPAMEENAKLKELPAGAETDAKSVNIKTSTVQVNIGGKDIGIFTRQGVPVKAHADVLFLHGMKFSSADWEEIGTLQLLAHLGFRAIAVDLPGYGKSVTEEKPDNKVDFMKKLIEVLKMNRPVLVSPSMSGDYSIPLLLKTTGTLGGFVPVAPVGTEKGTKQDYEAVQVPTWIIYGKEDKDLGQKSLSNLKQIPNNKVFEIEGANHAAYLDKPKEFHKYLYNFLLTITAASQS